MFWSKKEEPRDVACKTCGCMVLKYKAHKVVCTGAPAGAIVIFHGDTRLPDYYCSRCKPPYETVDTDVWGETHYYRTIEVAEDGKEVKAKGA